MDQRTLFVTGAASGIGQAVAQRFASNGWFVGLVDIDAEALASVHASIGTETSAYRRMDVTDPDSVQSAVEWFADHTGGRMDVLFNSAGVMTVGRFSDVDLDVHRRTVDVNLWGVLTMTKLAFPLLKATPGARVISMASASGIYGTPELASYAATKAAVRSLTQSLNLEWANHDIYVCDIVPPYVDTPLTRKALRARSMDRLGIGLTADDVVDVVEDAVEENQVHWPVGSQFTWLYRLSEVLPSNVVRLIMRYVSGF